MNLHITGSLADIREPLRRKLEGRLSKVAKLIDRKEDREAHIVLSQQRHLHTAEITVNAHGHALIGAATNADLFQAFSAAIDRLEKQAMKQSARWRDTHRGEDQSLRNAEPPAPSVEEAPKARSRKPRIYRRDGILRRKPMTAEEAALDIEANAGYMAYEDAGTGRIAVLIRRADGNFDLIET